MGNKKNSKVSLLASMLITFLIVAMLILSGPLASALKVTLSANKPNVTAGATGAAGNITFTTWVNLSSPDAYVPIQRIYLNLSGPLPRSFSFNPAGGDIQGYATGYPNEITIVANPSDGFNSSNYGFGPGIGYGYNTGITYPFGSGYGYGSAGGAGLTPLNVSYAITLNTTNMYDGNYTARTNVYAVGNQAVDFLSTNSVSFEILPRIITVPIPGIDAGNTTESGLIQTPVGNFSFMIVAGTNASAVNLNVTVQVNPPTNVSYQINASTGGLGAGAMPGLYFNYSIDDPTWYDNISYIHMRMYYNQSDIPSNVVESTLRPARYLSNTTPASWVKLECGTCPRTLEVAEDGRNVNLNASGVNETGNYVWANVTHFSSYGVAGTVTATTPPSSGGSSGGGGGGGGGGSGENFSNIVLKERYELQIFKDLTTTYSFKNASNPLIYVKITGNVSAGMQTVSVEVLKNTSTLVKIAAPGMVYKNVNIWVGTSGFATSKNIKDATINFKIDNSWLTSNGISGSDVKLLKWDGSKWIQLETTIIGKLDLYTVFEGKTTSFSPFAISAKVSEINPVKTPEGTQSGTTPATTGETTATRTETAKPPAASTLTYILIVIGIVLAVVIVVAYYRLKKKEE